MSNTLLTPEVRARIERRFEWADTDGNNMRANSNFPQYTQDITTLMAEVGRLEEVVSDLNYAAQKAMEHND